MQRRHDGNPRRHEDAAAVHAAAERGVSGQASRLPHGDAIQRAFGAHDISNIEAFVGGDAAEAAAEIGARAYATGNKVAFDSEPDLHTAAHEAAHVVQQRRGVALAGGVGQAGDPYEVHADAVADAVVRGESAEHLLTSMAGAGSEQPATQAKADSATANALVVGHASPRWEHLRGGDRAELNLDLSRQRANAVASQLQRMFDQALVARGLRAPDALACIIRCQDHALDTESSAVGHDTTQQEAPDDPAANDPSMRRVEILATITRHHSDQVETEAGREEYTPEKCESNATRDWAIQVKASASVHFVVGGGAAVIRLRNRKSGQEHEFLLPFGGGGVGIASTAGADPGWGDWSNFRTIRPVTLEDWDGTFAELASASVYLFVGYSLASFSAPSMLGTGSVNVSGPGLGGLGAGAQKDGGFLVAQGGDPADEFCSEPEKRIATGAKVIDVEYDVPRFFPHTAYFATQSSVLSRDELARLAHFAEQLADAYDAG